MNQDFYKITNQNEMILFLKIQPQASRSEIIGIHGHQLKIKIKAPPVDGKANEALVDFLKKEFGLKVSEIEIIRGEKSSQKQVLIKSTQVLEIIAQIKSRTNWP